MRLKAFYLEESVYNPGWYLIRVDVTQLPFTTIVGSLNVLPARLMMLSYANYLRFCRDVLNADIRGKNLFYPVAYFKRSNELMIFIKLLNARAKFVLWEDEHPDFKEHEKALKELEEKRNLKKTEN